MATANNTANFVPADGAWVLEQHPFAASVVIKDGYAVGIEISGSDVTGNLDLMGTENAAGFDFMGILAEPIAAADDDYATAGKLKSVFVPTSPLAKAKFYVGAGTFTAADVYKTVEFHSDSAGLAVDTAGLGARIVGYTDSTHGICTFSMPTTETA